MSHVTGSGYNPLHARTPKVDLALPTGVQVAEFVLYALMFAPGVNGANPESSESSSYDNFITNVLTASIGGVIALATFAEVCKNLFQVGNTLRNTQINRANRDRITRMQQDVTYLLQEQCKEIEVPSCNTVVELGTTTIDSLIAGYADYKEVQYAGELIDLSSAAEHTILLSKIRMKDGVSDESSASVSIQGGLSGRDVKASEFPEGTIINIEINGQQKHFVQVTKNANGSITLKKLELKQRYEELVNVEELITSEPWTRYELFKNCTNYTDIRLQEDEKKYPIRRSYAPLSAQFNTQPIIIYSVKSTNSVWLGGEKNIYKCCLLMRGRDGILRIYSFDSTALGHNTNKQLHANIIKGIIASGSLGSYFRVNPSDFLPRVTKEGEKYKLLVYDITTNSIVTRKQKDIDTEGERTALNRIIVAADQEDGMFNQKDLDLVFLQPPLESDLL